MTIRLERRALLAIAAMLLTSSVCASQAAPALTRTEQAIVRAVAPHNAEGVALLEKLVNINSGTMNFAGVRSVADVLRGTRKRAGIGARPALHETWRYCCASGGRT